MEDIVNLFVNNGTAIAVIIYFIYRDYKFMQSLQTTLATLDKAVKGLEDALRNLVD